MAHPFPNGHVTTTKDAIYKAGTILPIYCDAAYTSKSVATTCTASNQWDPQPACKLVCNDTIKVTSDVVTAYPKIGIGHTGNVTYRTNNFYLRSGTLTVECKENGKLTWEETPLFGNDVCIITFRSNASCGILFWLKTIPLNRNTYFDKHNVALPGLIIAFFSENSFSGKF